MKDYHARRAIFGLLSPPLDGEFNSWEDAFEAKRSDSIILENLTKGILVDDEDRELLRVLWQTSSGYAKNSITINGVKWNGCLHRAVIFRATGRRLTEREVPDHINHNPLDNRRCNLRVATYSQNSGNRSGGPKSRSGYRGVDKHRAKWRARITHQEKILRLGGFNTPEEAAEAYDQAARKLGYLHLNARGLNVSHPSK